jgi:hypothetical protein
MYLSHLGTLQKAGIQNYSQTPVLGCQEFYLSISVKPLQFLDAVSNFDSASMSSEVPKLSQFIFITSATNIVLAVTHNSYNTRQNRLHVPAGTIRPKS